MTQTLRRELREKIKNIFFSTELYEFSKNHADENDFLETFENMIESYSEKLADSILELRTFSKTDQEQPKYDVNRAGLDWAIVAGKPIEQEQLDSAKLEKDAQDTFERDMLFNPLPWDSTQEWQKFTKFVIKEYQKDKLIFAKYKTWQQNEGKFAALSNRKIKAKPQDFIDCFPDFLARSSMYGQQTNQEQGLDSNGAPISY